MAIIIFFAYSIRTIRNILYHIAWWEIKEYRIDRMKVHITETSQGKKWMFGVLSSIKWILLVLYMLSFYRFLNWIVIFLYVFEAIKAILQFPQDKRPSGLRPKIAVIFIITLLFELFIVSFISFDYPIGLALLIGDKLLPFIIFLQIFVISIPFWFYKQSKIQMAREKLSSAKNIRVIGITGSFGKTTVKEFIYQILSSKYKTLKTINSQNSDIGIAELILRSDVSSYDYLVCEMAAYHRGEIRSTTSMLGDRIDVAVITGINEQHQSLFGSLDTTKKAKYELIEALQKNGTVIVNAQNKQACIMGNWAKVAGYTVKFIYKKDMVKSLPKNTPPYFKINATLASKAAENIGMSKIQIKSALKSLRLPPKTMNEINKGKITIIDDTFNANPDAIYEALKYIKKKKGKKVLVLQPLIELGKYADKIHEKIGKQAAGICDYIILTNMNWYSSFMNGVRLSDGNPIISVRGQLPHLRSGIFLFEGKEAEKYMTE